MIEAFAIRNKNTGEQWVADSGKSSWHKVGAAKNAFNYNKKPSGYFSVQDEYEIVRLVPEELSKKDRIYKDALKEIIEDLL